MSLFLFSWLWKNPKITLFVHHFSASMFLMCTFIFNNLLFTEMILPKTRKKNMIKPKTISYNFFFSSRFSMLVENNTYLWLLFWMRQYFRSSLSAAILTQLRVLVEVCCVLRTRRAGGAELHTEEWEMIPNGRRRRRRGEFSETSVNLSWRTTEETEETEVNRTNTKQHKYSQWVKFVATKTKLLKNERIHHEIQVRPTWTKSNKFINLRKISKYYV